MNPGTLAVGGTAYTPDRSASRSRIPDAASALASGLGACASPGIAAPASRIATHIAHSLIFMGVYSERVFEADERRDLVAHTVTVEREQQIGVHEQTPEHVHLCAHCAVEHLKRIGRERHVWKHGRTVER